MTRFHMSQSLTGPLMNWKASDWRKATRWINHPEGRAWHDWRELKAAFLNLVASGHKVIPAGNCDNFDKEKGCLGHEIDK